MAEKKPAGKRPSLEHLQLPELAELNKGVVLEKFLAVKNFFEKQDALQLRVLANNVIKGAALHNDRLLARISVISYSLHKLLSKEHIVMGANWGKNKKTVSNALDSAIFCLQKNDFKCFAEDLDNVAVQLEKVDAELGNFVKSLYEKARIKYAADAYYLGMSLSQAAELTGADKKQLQEYVAFTKQHEEEKPAFGIKDRLNRLYKVIE